MSYVCNVLFVVGQTNGRWKVKFCQGSTSLDFFIGPVSCLNGHETESRKINLVLDGGIMF